jgi:hypothetical protein
LAAETTGFADGTDNDGRSTALSVPSVKEFRLASRRALRALASLREKKVLKQKYGEFTQRRKAAKKTGKKCREIRRRK